MYHMPYLQQKHFFSNFQGSPTKRGRFLKSCKGETRAKIFGGSWDLIEASCKVSACTYFFPEPNLQRSDYKRNNSAWWSSLYEWLTNQIMMITFLVSAILWWPATLRVSTCLMTFCTMINNRSLHCTLLNMTWMTNLRSRTVSCCSWTVTELDFFYSSSSVYWLCALGGKAQQKTKRSSTLWTCVRKANKQ